MELGDEVKKAGNSTSALFSTPLTAERQIECAKNYVALQNYLASLIESRRSAVKGVENKAEVLLPAFFTSSPNSIRQSNW
jgi:hypothetical protein